MKSTLSAVSNDMAQLVEEAAPAIVRVEARRRLPATGIAWADELIVTANHVVEIDDDISIGLPDGERVQASLVGRDPRNDLALLRVDGGGLTAANWADDEKLRVGDIALAVGRPRRLRASYGIVSGIVDAKAARQRRKQVRMKLENARGKRKHRRRGKWQKRMREWGGFMLADGLLQLDLTMYPGMSGGALVGADGGARGLLTSGFGGGVGIAVPVPTLRSAVTAIQTDGEISSGYVGVGVQAAQLPDPMADRLGQDTGLLVVSVEAGSPAAASGMLVGDILVALDDDAIADVDELQAVLARLTVGATAATAYVRGGELKEGSVVIGAR